MSYAPDFEICKIAAAPGRVPQIFHLLVVVVVGGGAALHINNLTSEQLLPLHNMVWLLLYNIMTVSF